MYFLQTITPSLITAGYLWSHRDASWNVSTNGTASLPSESGVPTFASHQVVDIIVGAAGRLAFNPDSVSVMTGTILRFNFSGRNHTLTQSSFGHPCSNSSQFDTGFHQFNPLNVSGKFLIDYVVESENPQWFYCAQDMPNSHCHSGMVFSVNAGDKSDEFVEHAKAPQADPLITSAPTPNFCVHTVSATRSTSPSDGTVSWTFQQPNTTSIFPAISNGGFRLSYALVNLIGSLFLVFM